VEPGHAIDGARSHCNVCDPENAPPRYDTDWSATGPLIEKWRIDLEHVGDGVLASQWGEHGEDHDGRPSGGSLAREGPTELIAVCNLILALKVAGKL
jgi:hypothetical protein